jgi:hypothetical protein
MKALRKPRLGLTYVELIFFRFLLWIVVLMLIVVAVRRIRPGPPTRVMEYGALVNNVDAGKVVSTTFTKLKNGEEIKGQLRTPAESFTTPILSDQIESLITQLRSRSVKTSTASEIPRGSIAYRGAMALALSPVPALLFLLRFQIKRLQRRLVEFRIEEAT